MEARLREFYSKSSLICLTLGVSLSHYAFLSQTVDLASFHTKHTPQHLRGMLAKRRRRAPYTRTSFGELHRGTNKFHRPAGLVLNLCNHPSRLDLLMMKRSL